MAILSWLRGKKHFMRRDAVDEFREYAEAELARLRASDQAFDEVLYRQAVDLVLEKLTAHKPAHG
ncbi:MAG TPA: hypothetical protein ENK62_03215 [Chromatiales bacterium]|nr:hypothetical protein [Chromatiales bacterium]